MDALFTVLNGVTKRLKDMGDGTHAEVIAIADSANSGSASAIAQTESYEAIAASTDVEIGDQLRRLELIDAETGESISVAWQNITQGIPLAAAPPADTIVLNSNDPVVDKLEEIRLLLAGRTFEAWLNLASDVEDNSTAIFDVGFPGLLASAVPVIGFAHQLPTGVDLVGAVVNDEFVTVTVTNNSGASLPSGTPVLVRARI